MPATTRAVSQPGEAELARRAARGDGEAFAELYERYSDRTFNLCYRIIGSRDDAADATQEAFVSMLRQLPKLEQRDLAFGSYLFTCARHACYDLMARRRRAEPHADVPEGARPVGAGGGDGLDPGDPSDDPERNVLLEDQQEQIRAANATLPARQREALALYELDRRSYDEIAEIMQMNRNSVAQLLSRARINLRSALRGEAVASIVHSTPECERALPLICASDDGQLDEASRDAAWLADHLSRCTTCPLRAEAMQEAGASYRAWTPIVAAPWLFRDTMARAAEAVGTDWSDVVERRRPREQSSGVSAGGTALPGGAGAQPSEPAAQPGGSAAEPAGRWWRSRMKLAAAVLVAALLLSVGVAAGLKRGERSPTPTAPAPERAPAPEAPATPPPPSAPGGERARKSAEPNASGAKTPTNLPATGAPQRGRPAGLGAAPALPAPRGATGTARPPASAPRQQQSVRRPPQRQPTTRRPPAVAPTPRPTPPAPAPAPAPTPPPPPAREPGTADPPAPPPPPPPPPRLPDPALSAPPPPPPPSREPRVPPQRCTDRDGTVIPCRTP